MVDVVNFIFDIVARVWTSISGSWLLSLALGVFIVKKWVLPALRNILYSN